MPKDFDDWLEQLKADSPELADFIVRLQPFFSDAGFNVDRFERRIQIGLEAKGSAVRAKFLGSDDAENKNTNG